MKLIIPGRYRQSRNKPRGKLEKKARAAFDRLKKNNWSHVRQLERVPRARVINIMYRYRLLSLDEGQTWELLNNNEYVKRIRRCYR